MPHPLQRFSTWLCVGLSLLAAVLAGVLWHQNSQSHRSQETLSRQSIQRTELQQELAQLNSQHTTHDASAQAVKAGDGNASNSEDEAQARERMQAYKDYLKQQNRRNALRSYKPGLEALHLPAQTLAQAKVIIVANWEARDAAYRSARTNEDRRAIAEQALRKEADQLTPLLGAEAYESVKASQRISSLDWTIGTDLWDGGAPLSQPQLQALALARVRTQTTNARWVADPLPRQIPDAQTQLSAEDTALLAATANTLTPAQHELLRRSLIEENQYNAAMSTFRKEQEQRWRAETSSSN